MLHFQSDHPATTVPSAAGPAAVRPPMDWSGEITPVPGVRPVPAAPRVLPGGQAAIPGTTPGTVTTTDIMGGPSSSSGLNMQNHLPSEVVDSPTTLAESYKGSMNAMLSQNIGNYVVVTFLVGTQGLVNWEGILYEVGNNYLTIYQESRDRYIVADIYSVKFVEFYDTQRRKLCDSLIQQNWQESQG